MVINTSKFGMTILASAPSPTRTAPLLRKWLSHLIPGVMCRAQGKSTIVEIPATSIEAGNIAQVWSLVSTLIAAPIPCYVQQVFLSPTYERRLGSGFGARGARELLGVKKRPLVAGVIGAAALPVEHAAMAYSAWIHGADIVRDSCLLVPPDRHFLSRLGLIMASKRRAEQHTGERKLFAPNITAGIPTLLTRAHACALEGCEAVVLNSFGAGIPAIQAVAQTKTQLVIADPCCFNAFTYPYTRGISSGVVQYLHSIAGTDILCETQQGERGAKTRLRNKFHPSVSARNSMLAIEVPSVRGVPDIMKRSHDVVLEPSNAVSVAGLRQAVEATMHGIPLDWYASVYHELRLDLKRT